MEGIFILSICGRECMAWAHTIIFSPFFIGLVIYMVIRRKKIKQANDKLKPRQSESSPFAQKDVLGMELAAISESGSGNPGIKHPRLTLLWVLLFVLFFIGHVVIRRTFPEKVEVENYEYFDPSSTRLKPSGKEL